LTLYKDSNGDLCELKYYSIYLFYLVDLDKQAEDMFSRLVKQMAECEDVTEQLKADNQSAWVGRMNNIRQRAAELVNTDLIYG